MRAGFSLWERPYWIQPEFQSGAFFPFSRREKAGMRGNAQRTDYLYKPRKKVCTNSGTTSLAKP